MADFRAPVVLLVHKRPQILSRVMEAVDQSKPSRIYVSGDGPRAWVAGEVEAVNETWRRIEEFPWSCPVEFRRLPTNVGSLEAVSSGISWMLEREGAGVIIEDDILIRPEALQLASRLLHSMRHDFTVGSTTMFNPVPRRMLIEPTATYRYSHLVSSEFWGTWADRWEARIEDMSEWESWLGYDKLVRIGGKRLADSWRDRLNMMEGSSIGSWEWRWLVTHWARNWKVVVSNRSYSFHLGHTPTATSATEVPSWYPSSMCTYVEGLAMPANLAVDRRADAWHANQFFGYSLGKRVKRNVGRRFPWLKKAWLWLHGRTSSGSDA